MRKWKKVLPTVIYVATVLSLALASVATFKWR